ncbi:unnamed protein product [Closterium sp. NIES-65]|nr:unnamed protein product [Closterium sp. NIES-65]
MPLKGKPAKPAARMDPVVAAVPAVPTTPAPVVTRPVSLTAVPPKSTRALFAEEEASALTLSAKLAAIRIEQAAGGEKEADNGKKKDAVFKDAVSNDPGGDPADEDEGEASGSGPSYAFLNDDDDGLIAHDPNEGFEDKAKGELAAKLLKADVRWDTFTFTLLAAYFPSSACCHQTFFTDVLKPFLDDNLGNRGRYLLAGDLNLVEDPVLDKSSGAGSSGENDRLLRMFSSLHMVDAYRALNLGGQERTFYSRVQRASSRIDRILVSAELLPSVAEASHPRPLKGISDHKFGVKVVLQASLRLHMGPGLWSMPTVDTSKPGAERVI